LLQPSDKHFRFKVSAVRTYQAWILVLMACTVLLVMFYVALTSTLKLMIISGLFTILYWEWQKLSRMPGVIIKQSDIDWVIKDRHGNNTSVVLAGNIYVSVWLVVLHFKTPGDKNISLVILPYMLDRNNFRQLSAYLRMMNLIMLTDE